MRNIRVKESFHAQGKGLHIFDFVKNARFISPFFPGDITELMQEKMKDIHPSQIIGCGVIKMKLFEVSYSYNTNRGNAKQNRKYMFLSEDILSEEEYEREEVVRIQFEKWVETFNQSNPYRVISNVEILEITHLSNTSLSIG